MSQHLISTAPDCSPCARCGRLRFVGLDGGLPYRVDPAPLTAHAELAAVLAGRHSYEHVAGTLIYRDHRRITYDITRGRPLVFADHDCRVPVSPGDIDTRFLGLCARLIERSTKKEDPTMDLVTENALFLVSRELAGLVIKVPDEIPF